nr:glycerol-3-phosphate dehydrogenase/oxidase [Ramlibacter aurantiacus]
MSRPEPFDLVVVGGGATGLGVALDATLRGLSVALVESHDFAGGTSSRATKLVHGGVRYLAQGRIGLVREALRERALLLRNAPHLAGPIAFVMPAYDLWEKPFYGAGLKLYDTLAGRAGLGATRWLNRTETLERMPGLRPEGLRGGIEYWDGQFEDARLALALARTAQRHGATVLNYCAVTDLWRRDGRLAGVRCQDREEGRSFEIGARCVVNATGVWVDALRSMDGEADGLPAPALVKPSQGLHVVVDRHFLPGRGALIVPRTADGRVLFAVPWLGKLILGTTDTPRDDLPREPVQFPGELDFILREAGRYLARPPSREDIRSLWVGLRPLVKPLQAMDRDTGAISREHLIEVRPSGLVTVTGGKWTTYRSMASAVLERCASEGLVPAHAAAASAHERLLGAGEAVAPSDLTLPPGPHLYGTEAAAVNRLPGAGNELGGGLTEAMVRFAAREEYARTVEDVLARRSRLLFLDARLAARLAGDVATILQEETGVDPARAAFADLAARYLPAASRRVA